MNHIRQLDFKFTQTSSWKLLSVLSITLLLSTGLFAQTTVTGRVTDASGDGMIGVTVAVKGSNSGALSESNGSYKVSVPSDGVLVFSFLGYETVEEAVNGRTTINVSMKEQDITADEVIITALGIQRETKALTYAAQSVNTDEIAKARDLNVVNSLSGKVAGLSISPSGAGVGAPSRVILRGNRSIAGNSQPLYVVDGVPIQGDITNVNPDDIASITVLKGPNAAALYGNRANNGAIIITTKGGKAGGFKVSLSSTYMATQPILLTQYQNEYSQGSNGTYSPASEAAWGAKMTGQSVAHWSPDPGWSPTTYSLNGQPNNVSDFFQTGHNWATNLAISGGTEATQTYFSYTYTDAAGIVPGNDLARHNVHLRITNKLSDRLTLDTKLNYLRDEISNQMPQGESFDNPIRHALRLPRNIRTEDASQFEYTLPSGRVRQNYWVPGSNGGANPYWTINRATNQRNSDRVIAFASLKYDIAEGLSLSARSSVDRIFRNGENRWWNDNYIIADNGRYAVFSGQSSELNLDALLTYEKNLTDDFYFNVNAGGNIRKERGTQVDANTGTALTVPNFFSIGNSQNNIASYSFGAPRDVNSVYAFATFSYKNAIFFDVTGRNDWSSTLPSDNWSFFYPSFGLNAVISDLVDLPTFITFAKVRGSWAEVGNDTQPFQTLRTASVVAGGANGFLGLSTTIPNANLLPEKTRSLEIGADIRFFNNRVGIDVTYYKSNSLNQLFSVALPVGSGASQFFTNGGDVQNRGIEGILSLRPVETTDFQWDLSFNYTRNRNEVIQINDERPSISVATDFMRSFRIEQGRPWGEVYSRGFQKDDQGRVIVGANGRPLVTSGLTELVANYNPNWLGGIRNEFNYKDLNVSFLVDMRFGGSVTSLTNAIIYADGLTEQTLQGREGGLVFGQNFFEEYDAVKEDGTPNDIQITSEEFWVNFGGRNAPVGEAFSADATNIRMREIVLGYRLPMSVGGLNAITFSVVGRNLFFFYNAAGDIDPEVIVGTGTAAEGFNSFAPPTMRSIGGSIKLDF
ncbi:MAG: SusC/RagA family TonB-linked outer membrane protein [Bacteroidia bacterium]